MDCDVIELEAPTKTQLVFRIFRIIRGEHIDMFIRVCVKIKCKLKLRERERDKRICHASDV